MLKFERDDFKAQSNLPKHNVPLEEAACVCGDALALTFPDSDHAIGEKRWLTFGISLSDRLLVVAHAERGRSIRIIAARKATRHERAISYEYG